MAFSGFRIKVFPQLDGPVIRTLRYFPLPWSSSNRTALTNSEISIFFRLSIFLASCSQILLQFTMHSPWKAASRRCKRLCCDLVKRQGASLSSQPTWIAWSTAFDPRLAINWARSVFPSCCCCSANAKRSRRELIFCFTAIVENLHKHSDDVCGFSLYHLDRLGDSLPLCGELLLLPRALRWLSVSEIGMALRLNIV